MQQPLRYLFSLLLIVVYSTACNQGKKNEQPSDAPFLQAADLVRFNQLVYKDSLASAFAKWAPDYKVVYEPKEVDGNFAIIIQKQNSLQYALVIRGSVIEFSNAGFQNFFLQDFNIFQMKKWEYGDTVKNAYISKGAYIGFQNLLQLRDIATGLSLKDFIEQKIPAHASLVITGHSLGGNLAYPLAGYLKKNLAADKNKNLQLVTFGAPAVGNAAFVRDLDDKFPNGERYAAELDIAPAFPDLERVSELAKLTGLDSVLQLGKLSLGGDTEINTGGLLSIANELLKKTNIINEENQYVQSSRQLRPLTCKIKDSTQTALSADALFNRAYRFHKVDMYAELLGLKALEGASRE